MNTSQAAGVEFISIPEWCRRVGCSVDSGYRAARRGQIAGLFRIGRLMRINWIAFVEATFQPGDQHTGQSAGAMRAPSTSAAARSRSASAWL